MCNDARYFIELEDLATPTEVVVAGGTTIPAHQGGTVLLASIGKSGSVTGLVVLRDVLFIPELQQSLLSVSKTSESGLPTTFC